MTYTPESEHGPTVGVRHDRATARHRHPDGATTRGWGPWRQEWISICSWHRHHDPSCWLCAAGGWRNVWSMYLSRLVYRVAPRLWRWLANRGRVP